MPALTVQTSLATPQGKAAVCDLSVVIVSYNTCDVLKRCFEHLREAARGVSMQIFVVDNGSIDGTQEMVRVEYPDVRLIESPVNLGFGAANNRALLEASGRYIILLNSDAFLQPDALLHAISLMDADLDVGIGGARLIGPSGGWQPSARAFPSLLNDFLSLSGLASRFRNSRFFGRADRTWCDSLVPAEVDWVPGAFSIIRPEALKAAGVFDEDFFLYYEEVDLCRRVKALGYKVMYWPDIIVVHLGGESSKRVPQAIVSRAGSQLTLWRMRSGLLFYRKHHGLAARLAYWIELFWHRARQVRNHFGGSERVDKEMESKVTADLLRRAWKETRGGRVSPPRPW